MDTTSCTKKLHSFESHKNQFLSSLTLHSLLGALTCSLLWYCLRWFLPLPNTLSPSLLTPKCLFIVVNIIVVFLVGESKLSGSNSSPSTQIYDEYVERSRNFRSFSTLQRQTKPFTTTLTSQDKEVIELPQEEVKEVQEVVRVQENSDKKEVEMEEIEEVVELENDNVDEEEKENCIEEESECGMPTEELNRRVEEFIARVNKQRWLEARFLVCCEA